MKNVKIISTILFYITRIVAILYILVTIYSLFSLLTEWSYILEDNGNYFAVCYPFTETRFLLGENNWSYKTFEFLIPIGAYGIFFLLVSNVFNAFKQPKLFTSYGINQLKWFCLANIFVPSFIILLASIFTDKLDDGLQWAAVIHFFMGVFAYFLYAIFKQGVNLQNEQDLYI
ncbi:DUF2975 domain-containing protein [Gelidibacter gilvus]|uniref:DUF2975 domain-containing protein n=1 Tax=Gelidibacter gilvus TaxID=59602 RepID=A0A4Q0X9M5_9FLAO|nr:DUF2975 domain-containing protein [Gelidibacter gilvus]RXJ43727.1 DUF2975 domain-containing protein [Gelidibacter gilvus]